MIGFMHYEMCLVFPALVEISNSDLAFGSMFILFGGTMQKIEHEAYLRRSTM